MFRERNVGEKRYESISTKNSNQKFKTSNLEASTTFIREFMEENDWFTYTYDLGDDWQHRVTIEKIIDNWEFNYPEVIKYKGDCPIEDCGGIYGYYDCLEVANDEKHPEHKERLEWMKSQGYPQEYDRNKISTLYNPIGIK